MMRHIHMHIDAVDVLVLVLTFDAGRRLSPVDAGAGVDAGRRRQSPGADPADLRRPVRRPSADPAADPAADRRQLAPNPLIGAAMCGVPPTRADRRRPADQRQPSPNRMPGPPQCPARGPRLPAPPIYIQLRMPNIAEVLRSKERYVQEDEPVRIDD
jgi:hypothetical protein